MLSVQALVFLRTSSGHTAYWVDDCRQLRYKCHPGVMLKPKLLPFRRSLIATLIIVGLLLPTLHFHPGDDHAHETDAAHRHGVVHADFFAVSGHQYSENADDHNSSDAFEVDSPWSNDQVDLVALTSHQLKLASKVFQNFSVFLYYKELTNRSRILSNSPFLKQTHPPPIPESYPSLGSPRSPPHSA